MLSGAAGAHGLQILLQIVKQIEKIYIIFFPLETLAIGFLCKSELKFKST